MRFDFHTIDNELLVGLRDIFSRARIVALGEQDVGAITGETEQQQAEVRALAARLEVLRTALEDLTTLDTVPATKRPAMGSGRDGGQKHHRA